MSDFANNPRMPAAGQVVAGRYRVERILGEGGFAAVYLAEDITAGGKLALKVMDPAKSSDPKLAQRFQQEVRVVRQLSHHNTVKIWDVGQTESGCLFFAMELVKGEELNDIIEREAPLPTGRVVRIIRQVLMSLAEAHDQAIVHRDLKPGNIMVSQHGLESDYVKVLDFGIAKALTADLSMVKTQTGLVMCTPRYAAPELLRGTGVVPATDLYALGLIMAEMLTGISIVTGQSTADIIAQQITATPVPLPAELVQHELGPVVSRAVEKDPAKRFASAKAMYDALTPAATAPGASPARDTLESQARKPPEPTHPVPHPTPPVQVAEPTLTKEAPTLSYADDAESDSGSLRTLILAAGVLLFVAIATFAVFMIKNSDRDEGETGPDAVAEEVQEEDVVETEIEEAPPAMASLTITGAEDGAEIYLNGVFYARSGSEPVTFEVVPMDEVALLVTQSGFEPLERAVSLPPGEAVTVDAPLRPLPPDDLFVEAGQAWERSDFNLALRLWWLACDVGHIASCLESAARYHAGENIPHDPDFATRIREQVCLVRGGDCSPLVESAEYWRQAYEPVRARALFVRICLDKLDSTSCIAAAEMAWLGEGVELEREASKEQLDAYCDEGDANACQVLGTLMLHAASAESSTRAIERLIRGSAERFEKACELGNYEGCTSIYYAYQDLFVRYDDWGREDWSRVDSLERSARNSMRTACEAGHAASCGNLAHGYHIMFFSYASRSRANSSAEQACALGLTDFCDNDGNGRSDALQY